MTELLIHTNGLDDTTLEQINTIKDHPALKGLIAIMPDAHAGAGCVIGFTGKFGTSVIPNIVGVDIGCGVYTHKLEGITELSEEVLLEFDAYMRRNIPLGMSSRCGEDIYTSVGRDMKACGYDEEKAYKITQFLSFLNTFYTSYGIRNKKETSPIAQLGTLGGGNHFIEIDKAEDNNHYLTIHSGSRNFGHKVATHFQRMAKTICKEMRIDVPQDLEYLPMSYGGNEYMSWARNAQTFADKNREMMLRIGLTFFDLRYQDDLCIKSVHNYIGADTIIRKGAISARPGEKVVIPLNSRDGILLGTGKGISSYNYSAPHGAGRVYGRKQMKRMLDNSEITMEQYKKPYDEAGIVSTSICKATIDESWMAYKPLDSIKDKIEETVNIHRHLKPVWFLKDNMERR